MRIKLDENTIIGDILDSGDAFGEVFLEAGMDCAFCPAARGESISEACEIHGLDAGELLSRLRAAAGKNSGKTTV